MNWLATLGLDWVIADVMVVVRLMIILLLLIYVVFSVLVIRQVQMMENALNGLLPLPVKTVAFLHLLAALLILGMALVI